MLWAADVNGRLASVTRAWHADDAGRPGRRGLPDEARPQAVAVVRSLVRSILHSKGAGSTYSRIEQPDGHSARVQVDASPAVSPDDGSFTGFLGSVHLIADDAALPDVSEVDEALVRVVMLDAVADHVIKARALAARADEAQVTRVLDLALLAIGDRLADAGR